MSAAQTKMSLYPDGDETEGPITRNETLPVDDFGVAIHFDRWLADLKSNRNQVVSDPCKAVEQKSEPIEDGIYLESSQGSKCEIAFDGVLNYDGHTIGNIRSPKGTLILTKGGRLDADIDVGVAVINGSVTGNITATEYVVLDNHARVAGQIHTRLLTVGMGAFFEGDLFAATAESFNLEDSIEKDELEYYFAAV